MGIFFLSRMKNMLIYTDPQIDNCGTLQGTKQSVKTPTSIREFTLNKLTLLRYSGFAYDL